MRGKTTLILLGILIVCSVYVYFVEIRGKAEKDRIEEQAIKLCKFEESEIQSVTLKRPSDIIVCEREGDKWKLTSPIEADADAYQVKNFVDQLARAKSERDILDVSNYSDYGLAPPIYTVIIESKEGLSDTLFFGEKNPTSSFLFSRRAGESKVVLTGTVLHTQMNKEIFDFRDKSVLPFEKDQVERIILEQKNKKNIVVEKEGSADWKMIQPIQTTADKSEVDGILNKVNSAKAKSFVEEKPTSLGKYRLTQPELKLTLIIGANKAQKQLAIGKMHENNRFYAKDMTRGPVFTVDTLLIKGLTKTVFDLRDKKIVHYDRDDVYTIEIINRDKPKFVCQRDTSDAWIIKEPEERKAKDWKISSLFSNVTNLKATKFIMENVSGLSQYGFSDPQAELIFKNENGSIIVNVQLGSLTGENDVYVINQQTHWIYTARNTIVNQLSVSIDDMAVEPESPAEDGNEQN